MGSNLTQEQKCVIEVLQKIFKQQGKTVSYDALQNILLRLSEYVAFKVQHCLHLSYCNAEVWDHTEIRLWDSATRDNKAAVVLLGTWCVVFEAVKAGALSQNNVAEGAEGSSLPECRKPLRAVHTCPLYKLCCLWKICA